MQVELSTLEGFHSLGLEDCQQALVTVEPGGSNSPHGEFILPFTFITLVKLPDSLEVSNVTENSAQVSWTGSDCSNSHQVLIVINKDGETEQEYQPQPQETDQLIQGLQPCSDYLVQVFGIEDGVTSDLAQMMFIITKPEVTDSVTLQAESQDTLAVNIGTDLSKCLQVGLNNSRNH